MILDVDFSDRSFAISFHSGVATFSLEVADDSIFENEEFFVLYIEIPTAIPACALLATIRDNDGNCNHNHLYWKTVVI